MKPASYPPPSHTVLRSADHVRLVAAFLHIDELMHASSLSRASHPLFDGDGVWDSRLRRAEAIQHVDDVPVPAAAVLSAAQLAALPSLPTLSDAAALCLQSYIAVEVPRVQDVPPTLSSEEAVQRCRAARVTAIVHLPSTLLYHARISKPDGWDKACTVGYYEFAFAWSGEEQRWRVDRMGERYSGWRAMNVDDNVADDVVELTAETSNDEPAQLLRRAPTTARSTARSTARRSNSSSSKQRYIELLGCSEHAHNGCHRLLPPSPPLDARCLAHYDYRALDGTPIVLPAVCPLPLCASCRFVIAGCIAPEADVNSVVRLSSTLFETDVHRSCKYSHHRVETQQHVRVEAAAATTTTSTIATRWWPDGQSDRCTACSTTCAIRVAAGSQSAVGASILSGVTERGKGEGIE